ncbi:alpha-L-fucosidase [Pseudactinotalea terrae]|uniref:alpha-L-fucosidase n=1 Tax=Pseudactinotalea terrae TaxID=1743262 RepID=UPI0012E2AADD|nr:alpha-L-fucosidase [Pseudactinotalea terrae]
MSSDDATQGPHAWFSHDRFGMFVHWGLYSLAARHEWVMTNERMSIADYERYTERFEADLYDPAAWARAAKAAGMTYVVLTTKHHDGFCLWDSDLTDYTSVNTPFGRDAVAEFVEAVRAEGLRVGFYHSLIDWHHPDFVVDGVHPRRGDDLEALNADRDWDRYRTYLHGQVRELLTRYGQVDYLFYDFSYPHGRDGLPGKGPDDWDSQALLALTRELQPGIIVNDRLGIPGDLTTPEQYQPTGPVTDESGREILWEACQTINGSWGYDRDNHDHKSPELLVRMLVDGVSKGGNLLLNVGPTGRGDLDPVAQRTLAGIAAWTSHHERSFRGAGPAPFTPPADARYTLRGDRLYLHLFSWPMNHVHLSGLAGKVSYVQFLHDASEVRFEEATANDEPHGSLTPDAPQDAVTLHLPARRPEVVVPVIEIFLKE